MGDAVLIVEKDDRVRLGMRNAFKALAIPLYEVGDAFDAMSALGRASFGALVVSAGKRQLSLRGLCQLARKRHPDVALFVITSRGVSASDVEAALGVDNIRVVPAGTTTSELAEDVQAVLRGEPSFDIPITDVEDELDSDEATRPHARASAGPARASSPKAAPLAQGAAAPLPPAPSQTAPATVELHLGGGGGGSRGGEFASMPHTDPAQPDRTASVSSGPEGAPWPPSSDENTTIQALAPDEPTATNFENPLLIRSEPSDDPVAAPPADPFDLEGAETEQMPVARGPSTPAPPPGFALHEQQPEEWHEEDQTESFPVARAAPKSAVPLGPPGAQGRGALPSAPRNIATPSDFSDAEPTVPMPAWQPPAANPSLPDIAAAVPGDTLPLPIELPPVQRDFEPTVETRLQGALVESSSSSTSEGALIEGLLEARGGAALLMTLLAQELTGRLVVDAGPAAGALFFLHGEPVFAEPVDGDAGFLGLLRLRGLVPPYFRPVLDDGRPIAPGQLLSVLTNRGHLSGQEVHGFLQAYVRERVLALISQGTGHYAFFDETSFLDTKPLLKVSSFGLILEDRRKLTTPDEVLRLATAMEWSYLHPRPALAPVAEKLRPFVRGAHLAEEMNGQRRVRQILPALGLDALMGTLVILALEDARLVARHPGPMESFDAVELAESTLVQESRFSLPDSEVEDSGSADESQAREEIFSLYMRLKPLNLPRDVLGVTLDADEGAIRAAYEKRMNALDPRRIPDGSARQLMASRVEELRTKVQRAFEALTATTTKGGRGSPW